MKIQRTGSENEGKFQIAENDRNIGLMTYKKLSDGVIMIDHTEVDSNHRGEGLGEDLVAEGVKYARENNLKIFPQCPFAKAEFDKHEDYKDVLSV